jgi:hypothetical protein
VTNRHQKKTTIFTDLIGHPLAFFLFLCKESKIAQKKNIPHHRMHDYMHLKTARELPVFI